MFNEKNVYFIPMGELDRLAAIHTLRGVKANLYDVAG